MNFFSISAFVISILVLVYVCWRAGEINFYIKILKHLVAIFADEVDKTESKSEAKKEAEK